MSEVLDSLQHRVHTQKGRSGIVVLEFAPAVTEVDEVRKTYRTSPLSSYSGNGRWKTHPSSTLEPSAVGFDCDLNDRVHFFVTPEGFVSFTTFRFRSDESPAEQRRNWIEYFDGHLYTLSTYSRETEHGVDWKQNTGFGSPAHLAVGPLQVGSSDNHDPGRLAGLMLAFQGSRLLEECPPLILIIVPQGDLSRDRLCVESGNAALELIVGAPAQKVRWRIDYGSAETEHRYDSFARDAAIDCPAARFAFSPRKWLPKEFQG